VKASSLLGNAVSVTTGNSNSQTPSKLESNEPRRKTRSAGKFYSFSNRQYS
jgi:hypothetical protein